MKPYQPAGLWKEIAMQDMDYVQSKGADLYRRSLYTFWKRTVAPPMMMNFDAAQREDCVVRENRTNTPLQALDLMNDVTFRGSRALPRPAHDEGRRRRPRCPPALRLPPGAGPLPVRRGSCRSCATICNIIWIISPASQRRLEVSCSRAIRPPTRARPPRTGRLRLRREPAAELDETVTKE